MSDEPFPIEAFGLTVGERIRWRRRAGSRWQEGVARGVNADGSLRITDHRTGAVRNLLADRVEICRWERGPRGGDTWLPVAQPE